MSLHNSLRQGCLLLAQPFMDESPFKKAAILLADHHRTGSTGFILNKPLQMNISNVLAKFPEFESEVYFGGPVGTETVHYIHTLGDILEGSYLVRDGVYWGGDHNKLIFLIKQGLINTSQIRFFIGYTGWSFGQIDEEIENGSWITHHFDKNYIFNFKQNGLWQAIMSEKGDQFKILSEMSDSINLN